MRNNIVEHHFSLRPRLWVDIPQSLNFGHVKNRGNLENWSVTFYRRKIRIQVSRKSLQFVIPAIRNLHYLCLEPILKPRYDRYKICIFLLKVVTLEAGYSSTKRTFFSKFSLKSVFSHINTPKCTGFLNGLSSVNLIFTKIISLNQLNPINALFKQIFGFFFFATGQNMWIIVPLGCWW